MKTLVFCPVLWYHFLMGNEKNTAASTPEMVTISRAEYDSQQAQLTELKLQNQWLLEQLGLARKRQFGASSEQLQEGTSTSPAGRRSTRRPSSRTFPAWLHADGYQGYHKLPENIRVVGCWAHARRKFDEALQTLPKEKRQESLAATGECYCTRLFQLEQALVELTPEERYTKRLELEKPVLDALLAWANETSAKTAPKF